MSHQLLLTNVDEQATFRKDEVVKALQSVHGIQGLQETASFRFAVRGSYLLQDDRTTVELSDDLKRLSFTGTGVAALRLALEIKKKLNISLRAFDTTYTFDVLLDTVRDTEDFEKKVASGEGV